MKSKPINIDLYFNVQTIEALRTLTKTEWRLVFEEIFNYAQEVVPKRKNKNLITWFELNERYFEIIIEFKIRFRLKKKMIISYFSEITEDEFITIANNLK